MEETKSYCPHCGKALQLYEIKFKFPMEASEVSLGLNLDRRRSHPNPKTPRRRTLKVVLRDTSDKDVATAFSFLCRCALERQLDENQEVAFMNLKARLSGKPVADWDDILRAQVMSMYDDLRRM